MTYSRQRSIMWIHMYNCTCGKFHTLHVRAVWANTFFHHNFVPRAGKRQETRVRDQRDLVLMVVQENGCWIAAFFSKDSGNFSPAYSNSSRQRQAVPEKRNRQAVRRSKFELTDLEFAAKRGKVCTRWRWNLCCVHVWEVALENELQLH